MMTLQIAFKNLLRRPTRSILTMITLAIMVASMMTLINLANSLRAAWRLSLAEGDAQLIVYDKDAAEYLMSSVPVRIVERLSQVPGVDGIVPELSLLVPIEQRTNVVVSGWPIGGFLWDSARIASGRKPRLGEDGAIVMGTVLAERLGYRVGDQVTLLYQKFRIVGLVQFKEFINNNRVLLPLPTLQRLAHRSDSVTTIFLRIRDSPGDDVRKRLSSVLSASDRHLSLASAGELTSNDQVLALINATARWISIIAGLAGLVVIANTMITAMNERTAEIGLLHAVGWSPFRIFAMVVAEALAIAACSGTLGVAIGAIAIRIIVTNRAIAPFVPGSLDLTVAFSAWVLTLVISVLGALLPAYRAGRIDPALALAMARR